MAIKIIASLIIIVAALIFTRAVSSIALNLQKTVWAKKYVEIERHVVIWNRIYDMLMRGAYIFCILGILYVWLVP